MGGCPNPATLLLFISCTRQLRFIRLSSPRPEARPERQRHRLPLQLRLSTCHRGIRLVAFETQRQLRHSSLEPELAAAALPCTVQAFSSYEPLCVGSPFSSTQKGGFGRFSTVSRGCASCSRCRLACTYQLSPLTSRT